MARDIRELENVVEHAFIIEASDSINVEALPDTIQSVAGGGESANGAIPGEPGAS